MTNVCAEFSITKAPSEPFPYSHSKRSERKFRTYGACATEHSTSGSDD
jgi:hypothetical protein